MNRLILASGSPRRLEILTMAGYDCVVIKPDADETIFGNVSPSDAVGELSRRKAYAVSREHEGIILAADTVVALDGEILGKPRDSEDARRMLRMLSGREHWVYTGFTVCDGEKYITETVGTKVIMRNIAEEELEAYVASKHPLDKAGAYGIQGAAGMFVSAIEGDYYTVVGLPLCRVSEILRESFGCTADI